MALRVEVCGIWFSESGGVWYMALREEVCGTGSESGGV